MLQQLLEHLSQLTSVTDKFVELEEKAAKVPESINDIIELVRLCKYQLDEEEFPELKQEQVLLELSECRQILVQSDEYFYI